ncbi:MAG: aminomethyl-transferring glycine dehydrogenase subunit GcvPA, partial [Aquificaceae bacterium]
MYIPHSQQETQKILKTLGLSSLEDLFSHIDPSLFSKPSLPPPKTEEELRKYVKELKSENRELVCFAGFGAYDRIVPSVIWQVLNRGEFLTAYTPYQPEASQGTLQAIFEYQSLICELTNMEVANASMYDGGSALAEAVLMARTIRERGKRVVLSEGIHPFYKEIIKTYLRGYEDEISLIPLTEEGYTDLEKAEESLKDGQAHALVVQYPNFLGFVEPIKEASELAKKYEVPFVVCADPIALSILKPPGSFGADIVVGEGQQMGIPLSFGGPYIGFFATRMEYVRKMPGRLVGMAEDI